MANTNLYGCTPCHCIRGSKMFQIDRHTEKANTEPLFDSTNGTPKEDAEIHIDYIFYKNQ